MKERRNAKMEEGREKVTAKGDVTRMAVSGSRTSENKAEFLVAEGMIEDLRKTLLLLGAGALGRQWWCLPETEQNETSHRWTRKFVGTRKAKERRKQFTLEMVKIPG